MPQQQPEKPETKGDLFDRVLLYASESEFEEFIAEAEQSFPTQPLELLREWKVRVNARLAAEPDKKVFSISDPSHVRLRYWYKIDEMLEAEINYRAIRSEQNASARLAEKSGRPGAEKQPAVGARRIIVCQNVDVSDKELCEILDRANIPLPKRWPEAGLKTWKESWETRQRHIHVIFSKDRKAC